MTSIKMTKNGSSLDFGYLTSFLEKDKNNSAQPFVSYEDGISPIRTKKTKHLYRYVLYCVPTFSNPSGTTLDMTSRRKLVEIARQFDILLITDDVYDFLDYSEEKLKSPIKRLVTIDNELGVESNDKGHTLSNCSFSKLLGPGLRCGWAESATPILAREMGESGANHSVSSEKWGWL